MGKILFPRVFVCAAVSTAAFASSAFAILPTGATGSNIDTSVKIAAANNLNCLSQVMVDGVEIAALTANDKLCIESAKGGSYCIMASQASSNCTGDNPSHICGTETVTQSADCDKCGAAGTAGRNACCDALAPSPSANRNCKIM